LTYSSAKGWLVSGSSDGTAIVWSTTSNKPVHTIDASKAEIRSIAISADGKYLAAGIRYGVVKVWSTADWKEQYSLPGSGDMVAVAFSPDGTKLATSEGDWNRGGVVNLRDAATGKVLAR